MRRLIRRWSAAAIATLLAIGAARGEVVLVPKQGNPMIGEAIADQDAETMTVRIYEGFTQKVPKAGVAKLDDRAAEYEEYRPLAKPLAGGPVPRPSTPARRAAIEAAIARYFAPGADQDAVLAEIRKDDAVTWREAPEIAKTIWKAARSGPTLTTGDQAIEVEPGIQGQVHIEVFPDGATGKLPVFLILHGGGEGLGDWTLGGSDMIALIKKTWTRGVFVCPSVLQKKYAEWGGNPLEEVFCKKLLKAVKRTWDVDTAHVYLGGYSMGGYGAWHIGGHQADVFAGLVAGAGGILIGSGRGETWGWGILGNLMHLPIVSLHGTADQNAPAWSDRAARDVLDAKAKLHPGCYRDNYLEYADGDHSAPYGHLGEAIPWALANERPACPERIVWEPSRPFDRHFYWLHVDEPRFFTAIDARRHGNEFELTVTRLAKGFSVLLDRTMIDIAKPVTVSVNGAKAFAGVVQPSLSAMIGSIDDKLDQAMWYEARIDLAGAEKAEK